MKKLLFIFLLLVLGIETTKSQYQILLNFDGQNGHAPYGSLTLVGSKFYGMTDSGGAHNIGCIFSIDTSGNNYKDILDFSGVNGQWPHGSLTFSNGFLCGMTMDGGVFGGGNIFSIDTDGTKYDNLYDIGGHHYDGYSPQGDLLVSGNKMYGMAYGGAYNDGVVFSLDTSGWGYKVLFNFNDTDGDNLWASGSLVMIGHRLYGVTVVGGKYKGGVIFSIDTSGSGYKILSDTSAYLPVSGLILSGNKFYGITDGFPATIFSIDTNGKGFKTLFTFNGTNGNYPGGRLTLSGNRLYGMTWEGGAKVGNGYGVVFSVDTNGHGFKDLFRFDGADGGYPEGSVTVLGNKVYGMASQGGADNMGVIFSIDTSAISTSINELSATETAIHIYPNPSTGIFTFVLSDIGVQLSVTIYNVLGKEVYSGDFTTQSTQINLSGEAPGVYFYRISTSDGSLINSGKLVIE